MWSYLKKINSVLHTFSNELFFSRTILEEDGVKVGYSFYNLLFLQQPAQLLIMMRMIPLLLGA